MATPTNPYAPIGDQYSDGLAAIIATLSGPVTIDDLATAVTAYVATLGYTGGPAAEIEIFTVAKNAINSYENGQCYSLYNGMQKGFISAMIGPQLTSYRTVDALPATIADIEDVVTKSGLMVDAQAPLLMATSIGQNAYDYLLSEIALGGSSDWDDYWSGALVSPTGNLPFWTAAAMEGALIGAKMSPRGLIAPTVNIVSTEIASAITSALMITFAKVILLITKRMQGGGYAMGAKQGCGCGH